MVVSRNHCRSEVTNKSPAGMTLLVSGDMARNLHVHPRGEHVKKPSVLIVDDSPFARSMVRRMVSAHGGYRVFEAEDGASAVALHVEIRPELTLLDLNMPGMDGIDVLTKIHETSPGAQIVVVTADRQQKTIDRALAYGAYAVLSKPPSAAQIGALLQMTPAVYV